MGSPASTNAEPVTAAAGIRLYLHDAASVNEQRLHESTAWDVQDVCFAARATMAPPRPEVADSAVNADKLTAEIVAEEKK